MSYVWWFVQLLVILLSIAWYRVYRRKRYWLERNVPGPEATWLLGNLVQQFRGSFELENRWRDQYGRVYGVFSGLQPVLTVCDPELAKQVLIKDFAHFINRNKMNMEHEIFNLNVFFAEDERWRYVRAIMSRAYTTGKLRAMHKSMDEAISTLVTYFDKIIEQGENVFAAKKVLVGFTIDVAAACIFATKTDANNVFDEHHEETQFVKAATKLFEPRISTFLSYFIFPLWLNRWLGYKIQFDPESTEFFFSVVRNMLEEKRKTGSKNSDTIQLLLDARINVEELNSLDVNKLDASQDWHDHVDQKASKDSDRKMKKLTDNEIMAQCFISFVAGFETTSSTLAFALHELAMNDECQERLAEEIKTAVEDIDDRQSEVYFETIMTKVPFLEAVIKETLRKYPPVNRLERRVDIDGYKLGGVELYRDQVVEIGAYAIHHDPQYYHQPEEFLPDRFMPENKDKLTPYTYLPFGAGPRNCLGMRFAYQEAKLALARLVQCFRFRPAPTTKHPVELLPGKLMMIVKSLDLAVEKR